MADRFDPLTVLVALNAIYFRGLWAHPFQRELTRDEPFVTGSGQRKVVPAMLQLGMFSYHEQAEFQAVCLPYSNFDMAMYIFASAIIAGQPIRLFNNGEMRRDFTYVDDVTEAVARVVDHIPTANPYFSSVAPDPASSATPWRIYNIGNNRTVEVAHVVKLLENEFGRIALKELAPMQPGDVAESCADVDDLMRDVGFRPSTPIEDGVRHFAAWYRAYHRI